MSSKDKEAADKGANASTDTAAATSTTTPQPRVVQYVGTRPLSAGESPDIVPARVKHQVGDDPNTLDLIIVGADGENVEVLGVRRSDRQEPGTWYEGGK